MHLEASFEFLGIWLRLTKQLNRCLVSDFISVATAGGRLSPGLVVLVLHGRLHHGLPSRPDLQQVFEGRARAQRTSVRRLLAGGPAHHRCHRAGESGSEGETGLVVYCLVGVRVGVGFSPRMPSCR